ncbi:hypothetical protein ACLOJK_005374 [Asimina triloba]
MAEHGLAFNVEFRTMHRQDLHLHGPQVTIIFKLPSQKGLQKGGIEDGMELDCEKCVSKCPCSRVQLSWLGGWRTAMVNLGRERRGGSSHPGPRRLLAAFWSVGVVGSHHESSGRLLQCFVALRPWKSLSMVGSISGGEGRGLFLALSLNDPFGGRFATIAMIDKRRLEEDPKTRQAVGTGKLPRRLTAILQQTPPPICSPRATTAA